MLSNGINVTNISSLRKRADNVETLDENANAKKDEQKKYVHWSATKLIQQYLALGKARLTSLVIISSIAGYFMGSGPPNLGSLFFCAVGTGFTSASSHVFNQLLEVPYDAMMARTKQRLLVQNSISTGHAVTFGILVGFLGLALLFLGVNPTASALGALTWFLYVCAYTPMKQISIYNTWVGSVVGALPTLMGHTASTNVINTDGLLLFAISFAWQFPHFNSLSWYLRHDYGKAGYKMMSVCDQDLCRSTTLRYSFALVFICFAMAAVGLTSYVFVMTSLPVNILLVYLSYDFYKRPEDRNARKLFRYSLIYLPLIFTMMLLFKKRCDQICNEPKYSQFQKLTL